MKSLKLFFVLLPFIAKGQTWTYPNTGRCDSNQTYHGKEILDEYQWLEQDTIKETKEWVLYQQKTTESFLRSLNHRDKIALDVAMYARYDKLSRPIGYGNKLYYMKQNADLNQAILMEINTLTNQEKILLNPNEWSSNATISLDDLEFSNDQKYLAYTVSSSGSDWRTIYVLNLQTGKPTGDSILYTKFTNISWDAFGFYYNGFVTPNRIAKPNDENNMACRIYYHRLNTSQSNDKLIYEDAQYDKHLKSMQTSKDGNTWVVSQSGGFAQTQLFFKTKTMKQWKRLSLDSKSASSVISCEQNKIWVLTNDRAANNKLMVYDVLKSEEPKVIIPESNVKMSWVKKIGNHLMVCYIRDAGDYIEHYNAQGQKIFDVQLPGKGSVGGFEANEKDSISYYTFSSYLEPATIFKYNLNSKKSEPIIQPKTEFNLSGYEMKQEFFKDQQGKMIPIFLVHKKGILLDGKNPMFLYGYGGFNISMIPSFNPWILPFIAKGGVYAMVCLKGGGEFGEKWHEAGKLQNKPAVFDDFIASAGYLIKRGYTNEKKLAIHGRSNGGLLVGACITKRPDLFKVAIGSVGVYDMLRYHKFTIGWTWATEYGVSDSADMFEILYNYSPYHQVSEQKYPATMLLTADHDNRVVPMHTYKFGAKLQQYNKSEYPILIRVDREAGHGAGKPMNKAIKEWTDIWSFVYYYLNM